MTALEDRTVPTPVITVQALGSATEGGSDGVIRLTRTPTSGALSVGVSLSGSAASGDYLLSGLTQNLPELGDEGGGGGGGGWVVTFADGNATVDVTVGGADDITSEPTETFILTLLSGSGYTVGTPSDATVNILDNDPVVVSVAAISGVVEGAYNGQFLVTRTGDLSTAPTVSYTIGGTATSGDDYLAHGGSFQFVPGSATAGIFFTALRDNLVEGDETITLTLVTSEGDMAGGYTIGGSGTATLTVTDLMYSGTFEQDGTSVLATVKYVAGQYLWNYRLTNVSRTPAVSTFSLLVDDASVVSNLGNSKGWSGSAGSGYVTWQGGTPIDIGEPADFWFKTAPLHVQVNSGYMLVPTATPVSPGGTTVPQPIVSGSITAVRGDGTDSEEGWVSENNDNDNYNFYGDPDTSLDQMPDLDELGQVAYEDDLVPLKIAPVTGAASGDVLTLDFASTNIRLWRNADKSGGQITTATTFNPRVQNIVYVEGLALSSAVNAESVSLKLTGGGLAGPGAPGRIIDGVLLTVFRVKGPQNVPGYSRHTYETILPGQVGATYGAITGGTQHSVSEDLPVNGGQWTQNTLIVNWGEGEVVGTYVVNAPNGFSRTRQVNVVKVQLDIAGADNKLVLDGAGQKQTSPDPRGIDSAPEFDQDKPLMYASIKVTRVAGPLVGEQRRGQRFINVGFMQTVKHVSKHGDYISAWTGNFFSMVSSTEGRTYIDVAPEDGTGKPWYHQRVYNDAYGKRNYMFFDEGDGPVLNTLFDMADAPRWSAVGNMVEEDSTVHRFAIKAEFMTYFAVHTIEEVNNAHESYTIRASVPWSWNASGNVNGGWLDPNAAPGTPAPTGKWTPDAYPNGTVFTPANPKKLTEVISGEIVSTALTKGTTSNKAQGVAETWTRTPPLIPPPFIP